MPKVTVIIPTHNRASLLPVAVNSVLRQTFGDFELLIVDDASQDHTAKVVQGFSDPRIRYIRHDVNRGEAGTRNTGVQNARGKYVAYIDDDDEWLPDKLEKQVKVLDSSPPQVGVVYTGMQTVELGTRKRLQTWIPSYRGRVLEPLLEKSFPTGASMLARIECFQKVGLYNTTIRFGPDWDMSIRLATYFDFEVIPEPLYCYSTHSERLTGSVATQLTGLEKMLELHADLFAKYPKAYGKQVVKLGLLHYLNGNPAQARVCLRKGMRRTPWSIRPYKLYLLSFLSQSSFQRLLTLRERAG